jgi:CheY-like chemotaxis protein
MNCRSRVTHLRRIMKDYTQTSDYTKSFHIETSSRPSLGFTFAPADAAFASKQKPSTGIKRCSSASSSRENQPPLVYIVDDQQELTELYTIFLRSSGYRVLAFNEHAAALTALSSKMEKPELLVLDYVGHPMTVNRFMQSCRLAHPTLRFLMASGFSINDAWLASVSPDRFLRKPFASEEFLHEVQMALAVRP